MNEWCGVVCENMRVDNNEGSEPSNLKVGCVSGGAHKCGGCVDVGGI